MPSFLRITGFGSHAAVVERVRAAIDAHGTLLDVHLYSGVAIAMRVEVAVRDLEAFLASLTTADVRLEAETTESVRAAARALSPDASLELSIHVTVADGDASVKREIPSVPG